jgi:glycosyltransferase 2 family protein
VASSFANRLTPASLGGIGLNVRYLQGAGLDRPAAVAAVAVNTAAGALVHLFGLLVAAVLIGHTRPHTAHIPRGWPVLAASAVVLAAVGLALWSPLGRRRLVIPAVRAGRELAGVLRRPGKAAQLLGGSAGVTLTYALTLAGCLAAVNAHPPLASVVAVYLAGAAVASVSPTPGGLGAMEAALVAGLTAVGAPAGPAVAGVLAFRLLTFWLPILPGWLAYRALRADGTI